MMKSLVCLGLSQDFMGEVKGAAGGCRILEFPNSDAMNQSGGLRKERDFVGIIGATPADDLSAIPHLDWVHSGAAGVDAWLSVTELPVNTTLTSAVSNGAIPLAEHALMLMLMLDRNAQRWQRAQNEHSWDRFVHGELTGRTLGIIGFGHSGADLAKKAQACHMNVQALRRKLSGSSFEGTRLLYGREGLEELLGSSDFVVVTAPFTPETDGMIGAEELALMQEEAFLIVISRGGIVQEEPLVQALSEGHIAGAGLDAHATEPLPTDSPLWDLPNTIITPHNGATTENTASRGRGILLENVRRWSVGEELLNIVDLQAGY